MSHQHTGLPHCSGELVLSTVRMITINTINTHMLHFPYLVYYNNVIYYVFTPNQWTIENVGAYILLVSRCNMYSAHNDVLILQNYFQ